MATDVSCPCPLVIFLISAQSPTYIESIFHVIEITNQFNMTARRSSGNESLIMPEVVRKLELCPLLNIYLPTRGQLLVMADLAKKNCLVIGIYSTGNMIDLKTAKHKGKIQLTQINVKIKECILTKIKTKCPTT